MGLSSGSELSCFCRLGVFPMGRRNSGPSMDNRPSRRLSVASRFLRGTLAASDSSSFEDGATNVMLLAQEACSLQRGLPASMLLSPEEL